MPRASLALLLAMPICAASFSSIDAGEYWPRWRGADGFGQSDEQNLPVSFTAKDVAWKLDLKGVGQSSPTIWRDKIFITEASEDGRQRFVLCVDKGEGQLLWRSEAPWSGEPEPLHKMNSYASATCATDGKRVVAFFGRGGLHCFDMDGKLLWSRELGSFESPWGTAASPVIVGNLVIQNCDAENDAFLLAVDPATGETVWRTPREKLRGWSTPVLVDAGARQELVVNGETGVNAYLPSTGEHLWFVKGDTGRGTPTVVQHGDLLIAVNGRPGDMVAMRPGGSGTVNDTHEVWRVPRRSGRDLPSPIVVGDYLFVVNMGGVAACYDPATGKQLDTLRLGGNFSASPIAAEGLIYLPSEEGEIIVIKPGEKLEVVAKNPLPLADGDIVRASLAPSEGRLYCRSNRALLCIGK